MFIMKFDYCLLPSCQLVKVNFTEALDNKETHLS